MIAVLREIAERIEKPSAIIVVSAHWEETEPTITAGSHPALIYDYHGFPEKSYSIQYPCPGGPALAQQVHDTLSEKGFTSRLDEQRGFDHGLFIPLKIMYPEADVPCIQLSLLNSLDPLTHIEMGAALAGLGGKDLLIIGSGFSFHNLRAFFAGRTAATTDSQNEAFERWLIETCSERGIDETERRQRLEHWYQAPFARYCHPREEHLLPLHVCYGAAGTACSEYFELRIMNKKASMYLW